MLERLPSAASLDKFSYRINAAVFPLWTFTIIAGAIWAGDAWGRYWGWDPKEVWSFITWVAYACYLHARATAGWKGRKAAYLGADRLRLLPLQLLRREHSSTASTPTRGLSRGERGPRRPVRRAGRSSGGTRCGGVACPSRVGYPGTGALYADCCGPVFCSAIAASYSLVTVKHRG